MLDTTEAVAGWAITDPSCSTRFHCCLSRRRECILLPFQYTSVARHQIVRLYLIWCSTLRSNKFAERQKPCSPKMHLVG